ncbi:MAG: MipA/OmpV family protein [Desulfobacteraceae bacterium]|nr:MAG: MipA/OmpV family protein [Desulfobacteraceae bacterium]
MRIYFKWMFVFLCLSLLNSQNARGEEKPLWELGLGAAALRMPDYRGSDENRNYLLPYPYLIYRGDFLKIDKDTISGRLFKTDRLLLDISLFGNMPVDSSENSARSGMPDLDPTFQVGPSLKIKLLEEKQDEYKLTLALPVRAVYAFDFPSLHHEGWVFSPRLEFEKADIVPGSGLNLWASAGLLFATRPYHEYYYSVDPAYAAANRPAYAAEGGYGGSVLTVGLNKQYKKFSFNLFANMDFLHQARFEDSPLVKDRSTVIYGISVSRLFMKSKRTVVAD